MKTNHHLILAISIAALLLTGLGAAIAQAPVQQPSQLSALQDQQTITGGVGMTIIDGKPYYLFNLTPELSFGKIGVGLDINVRVGEDGKVRREDFKDAKSYLRLIRYLRYGAKHEPFYARVGALDYSRLGHGYIPDPLLYSLPSG